MGLAIGAVIAGLIVLVWSGLFWFLATRADEMSEIWCGVALLRGGVVSRLI